MTYISSTSRGESKALWEGWCNSTLGHLEMCSISNKFSFKTTCLIFRDKVYLFYLSLFFKIEKPENLKSICLKISESLNSFSRKVQIDLPQNLVLLKLKT